MGTTTNPYEKIEELSREQLVDLTKDLFDLVYTRQHTFSDVDDVTQLQLFDPAIELDGADLVGDIVQRLDALDLVPDTVREICNDDPEEMILVCDSCFRACCWQGEFMCDHSYGAGVAYLSVNTLKKIEAEHEQYWKRDRDL